MSTPDDEFDELFSFSVLETTTSNSSFKMPLVTAFTDPSAETTQTALFDDYVIKQKSKGIVSDTTLVPSDDYNGDNSDDVFGEFDFHVNTVKPAFAEDDFHTMDADTREMLEFLDQEPIKSGKDTRVDTDVFLDIDDDDMDSVMIADSQDLMNLDDSDSNIILQPDGNILESGATRILSSIEQISIENDSEIVDAFVSENANQKYSSDVVSLHTMTTLNEFSSVSQSKSFNVKADEEPKDFEDVKELLQSPDNDQKIEFTSFHEALSSSDATIADIKKLMFPTPTEIHYITTSERPSLWTKLICCKTVNEIKDCSLADSFSSWYNSFDFESFEQGCISYGFPDSFRQRFFHEVNNLTCCISQDHNDERMVRRHFSAVLLYFYESLMLSNAPSFEDSNKKDVSRTKEHRFDIEWNEFIGPIIATLLSSSMIPSVANVVLSRILPTFMPLVSLSNEERLLGARSLHQALYFLISYHIPLLVLHLDRQAPGWFWPSVSNSFAADNEIEEDANVITSGMIPASWFISMLAGTETKNMWKYNRLLQLWDIFFVMNDQSLKFYIFVAIMEKYSYYLLTLKGSKLINKFTSILSFEGYDEPGYEHDILISEIYHNARKLQDATPISVTSRLRKLEDDSINRALAYRSKAAMDGLTARLEAETEAHRIAVDEQNKRKLNDRVENYYKSRLINFYKKHCPEKVESVDKIIEVYHGRFEELDAKLHSKYGSGFLPLVSIFNPKIASQTSKLLSNVGHGIETQKKNLIVSRAKERSRYVDELWKDFNAQHQVAMKVSASEVIPFICGSKNLGRSESLKFYLVDTRTLECRKTQGSFPTSASLTPEDLMEDELILEKVDMFESLRGAVHVVVMGEGFSAFPSLYNHPLNENEQKLLDNDESRTNMCALFFIKKGFPFVSILDGGFAAAHAWLVRGCDDFEVKVGKVLIDYDEESSPFADLERTYRAQKELSNASTLKKTNLTMQLFIDNSMARLATAERRIGEFTSRSQVGRSNIPTDEVRDLDEKKTPFFSIRKKQVERIELANQAHLGSADEVNKLGISTSTRMQKFKIGMGKTTGGSSSHAKNILKSIPFKMKITPKSKDVESPYVILQDESVLFDDKS